MDIVGDAGLSLANELGARHPKLSGYGLASATFGVDTFGRIAAKERAGSLQLKPFSTDT